MRLREQFKKESGFDVEADGKLNHAIYWLYIGWLEAKLSYHLLDAGKMIPKEERSCGTCIHRGKLLSSPSCKDCNHTFPNYQPAPSPKSAGEVLADVTGIGVVDLDYMNENTIIRPSEAIEAMKLYKNQ